ncbi:MAG: bifunctional folylpolyglutamate synthase/dihydrofolate synthase [Saprospiraceae bacterium]|nr:bifunctional folylpolyglutamate synthase/dihydrofolate synthase [Saprospiraceae bacterium]
MTYQQTIDYLFEQLPMFQQIGEKAFRKDVTNTLQLAQLMGNPHLTYPSIHIAGTNGKGSTAHGLSTILQAHGLKVGLYTSPHYRDFRERIKINGEYVTEQFIVDFVAQYKEAWQSISPSFFEITVVMAFLYFAKEKVDVAVIETGLGGRYDSTNIITPFLSVITNISYDHQQILGNTLPKIASSKAGIIKPKVPVVIGERQEEVESVFLEAAQEAQSPICFANEHYRAVPLVSNFTHTVFDIYCDGKLKYAALNANLTGNYQQYNIQTILQAVDWIPPHICQIEEEKLRYALENLKALSNFIGRWEYISTSPRIICDSAHNEAGIQLSMQQLEQLTYRKLHLVIGFVKDKKLSQVLPFLPKNALYYFAKADLPRGLKADSLKYQALLYGLSGNSYASVTLALEAAKQKAQPDDLIYVGGSIFVVAEVI